MPEKPWFRLYVSMTQDRRLRREEPYVRWAWVCVLAVARRAKVAGFLMFDDGVLMDAKDLADEAAITLEQARYAWGLFTHDAADGGLGWVIDVDGIPYVDGWSRKQFESDTSAVRMRKWRAERAAKAQVKAPVTSHDRHGDGARVQRREQSTEKPNASVSGAKPAAGYTPAFEEFWSNYPRKTEKKRAYRVWNARMRAGVDPTLLMQAAKGYADVCRREGRDERVIKMAATFLGADEVYLDYMPKAPRKPREKQPCVGCGGSGVIEDADGVWGCGVCHGTGVC